jgi:hypothetical protein
VGKVSARAAFVAGTGKLDGRRLYSLELLPREKTLRVGLDEMLRRGRSSSIRRGQTASKTSGLSSGLACGFRQLFLADSIVKKAQNGDDGQRNRQ